MTSNHKRVSLISIYNVVVLLTIIHVTTQFTPLSVLVKYRGTFRNIPRVSVWYPATTDVEENYGPRPAMITSNNVIRHNVRNIYGIAANSSY